MSVPHVLAGRWRPVVVNTLTALALGLAIAPGAVAAAARTSLPEIEREVMCPVCGVPLTVADSPQADRERHFIRGLIARGETKPQIKRELVSQFGPAVLALPARRGFGWAAYLVPAGLLLAVLAGVAVLVSRWQRRGRAGAQAAAVPALSPVDSARLDKELGRYDR